MAPMAPDVEVGREFAHPVKKLTEMTPSEVFDQFSSKAKRAGESAITFGGKVFSKIQNKFTSGQMKEGAVHIKESISTNLKGLWHSLSKKGDNSIQELKEEHKQ